MTRELGDFGAFMRAAQTLGRAYRRRKGVGRMWAPLVLVTDPVRLPDAVAAARRLPRGGVVIHRTFGRPDAEAAAWALAAVARRRGLTLLIGADEALARRVRAHGLHLPERALARARRVRSRNRGWVVTGAAHDRAAVAHAAAVGVDAILVSPVFASRSPSAGSPVGPTRLAALTRGVEIPIYALGGVNARTVRRLSGVGIAGVAALDAFRT